MKKFLLPLVPMLLLGGSLFAQSRPGETTLFEIGTPVTTDAANFDNLFRNFPKYIANGDEIEFLSYEKVGTIKNRGQIKKYLKQNFAPDTGFYLETITYKGHENNGENWFSEIKIVLAPTDRVDIKNKWKNWMDTAEKFIHPGMAVYEIEFIHALRSYRYYVFVDPTTHKVVTKGNTFAKDIPIPHVAFIDSGR